MTHSTYVSAPVLILGEHVIPAEQIRDGILDRHPEHPKIEVIRKALGNLPGTRRYFQPYMKVVSPERTAAERKNTTFDDLAVRAEKAALEALKKAGLTPSQIDCIIVTSATGDKVPGLATHLQNALGMRRDVRPRSMTQAACAGGALALIYADDYLAKRPDDHVLVIAAEELSSLYQEENTTVEDMIYKQLWGDCVAAVVVAARPLGPGLRIDHTTELTIPHTTDRYAKVTDHRGDHFASTRASLRSVSDLAPDLRKWLADHDCEHLDFAVLHPGGPAILDKLGTELGLDGRLLRHSRGVLAEEGNLGGPTIFSVLARTHLEPPAPGGRCLVFGLGPGVFAAGLIGTWIDPAR